MASDDARQPSPTAAHDCYILALPPELIDGILSHLTPTDLAIASAVCRALRKHATSELSWQRHVQSNVPGHEISTPYPCGTWRELYVAHDPRWFLVRHKLWFCDRELTGQMIIVRYDERRGCIEGYQLLANRARDGSEPWIAHQGVHIHYFEPRVKLHLDKPVLQFDVRRPTRNGGDDDDVASNEASSVRWSAGRRRRRRKRPFSEYPMCMSGSDPRFSNFRLTKPLARPYFSGPDVLFPYEYVWPPPAIPARHRVVGQPAGIIPFPPIEPARPRRSSASSTDDEGEGGEGARRPRSALRRSEISDQVFQIRQWLEMGPPQIGVHLGEEIVTYSTLDPALYTPTPEKPWRGIWVGDYSGHGCEFLLIHQPDEAGEEGGCSLDPLKQSKDESDEAFGDRFLSERVHRGRLEAIKLTGDPNVPRGEYTFIADELGDAGFVGVSQEEPFRGARVVKSRGHIASIGFFNGKWLIKTSARFACLIRKSSGVEVVGSFIACRFRWLNRQLTWLLLRSIHGISAHTHKPQPARPVLG